MKCIDIYSAIVPGSIGSIETVVKGLTNNLKSKYSRIDECVLFDLKVILNEALVNAVKHGSGEDEGKVIKVDACVSGDNMLYIIVEDEGAGYNFENASACSLIRYNNMTDFNDLSESGRGMTIIQSLCDIVKVNRKGNKIVLAKSIV